MTAQPKASWNVRLALRHGDEQARADLATFVQEHLTEVEKIVQEAKKLLKKIPPWFDPSFDGYLSGDRTRVRAQVEAIFQGLQRAKPKKGLHNSYRLEPCLWYRQVQLIRLAREVLDEGDGNCLEWSLVLAACLLRISIYPLIIVTCSSAGGFHAVLGYWVDDLPALKNERVALSGRMAARLVAEGRIYVVEATRIPPDERGRLKALTDAEAEALSHFPHNTQGQRVMFAVDIRVARESGIIQYGLPDSVYHNALPPREPNFVGRRKEKEELLDKIFGRAFIVSVNGLPGVGKTALALEVAHGLLSQKLFEGIIWVDAKSQRVTLEHLLDVIARDAFHQFELANKPQGVKYQGVRKLLEGNRCLLILDSYEEIADQKVEGFLRVLPEPSKVLITSREREHSLPSDDLLLQGLPAKEALKLLRSLGRLKSASVIHSGAARDLRQLYELTGGNPFALQIAVGLVADGASLEDVANILVGASRTRTADDFWKRIFRRTWQKLTPQSKQVLMAASTFPAPLLSESLLSISGVSALDFQAATAQLVRMALTEANAGVDGQQRYGVSHPLVRSYARQQLESQPGLREQVMSRAKRRYLEFLEDNAKDLRDGYNAIDSELQNIFAVLQHLQAQRDFESVLKYLRRLSYFLLDRGYWRERLEWSERGYQAATELAKIEVKNYRWAAKCAYWIGWYYCRSKQYTQAAEWAETADFCFKRLEPRRQEPRVTQLLGMIQFGLQNYTEAQKLFHNALSGFECDLSQAKTDRERENKLFWLVTVKTNLGDLAKAKGDKATENASYYEEAEKWHKEVLQEARSRCCSPGTEEVQRYDRWAGRLARSLGNLGDVYRRQGRVVDAVNCYEKGYRLAKELAYFNTIAACAVGLGLLLRDKDPSQAKRYLKEGLDIYERLGSRALGEAESLEEAREWLRDRCHWKVS